MRKKKKLFKVFTTNTNTTPITMFKKGAKFGYKIQFEGISGVQEGTDELQINWKRGAKKENQGTTSAVKVANGEALWKPPEVINLNCTLFKNKKKKGDPSAVSYEEKLIIINIVETKKGKVLSKVILDLSTFANPNNVSETNKYLTFKPSSKSINKGESFILSLTITVTPTGV